jgi:cobaltochelatase CobN
VGRAFEYLARGGLANLEHVLRFVADRLLGTSFGFAPPEDVPAWGIWGEPVLESTRPTVGVVFYRAHVAVSQDGDAHSLAHLGNGLPIGAPFVALLFGAPVYGNTRPVILSMCHFQVVTRLLIPPQRMWPLRAPSGPR